MKLVRQSLALMISLVAVGLAGGPLGCVPPPPPMPGFEVPQIPKPPDLKAPEVKLPEPPKGPDVPPPPQLPGGPAVGSGNCCLRSPDKAAAACGYGVDHCCTSLYDRSTCEDGGGYWFDSTAGCTGAC